MLTVPNVTLTDLMARTQRIALLVAVLTSANATQASPALIEWPTYLRTGPGRQFAVLQELARGAPVDVLGCTNHWCAVRLDRGTGYVEQHTLDQPTPPATPNTSAQGCFNSQRAGYESGETFRYCPR